MVAEEEIEAHLEEDRHTLGTEAIPAAEAEAGAETTGVTEADPPTSEGRETEAGQIPQTDLMFHNFTHHTTHYSISFCL